MKRFCVAWTRVTGNQVGEMGRTRAYVDQEGFWFDDKGAAMTLAHELVRRGVAAKGQCGVVDMQTKERWIVNESEVVPVREHEQWVY